MDDVKTTLVSFDRFYSNGFEWQLMDRFCGNDHARLTQSQIRRIGAAQNEFDECQQLISLAISLYEAEKQSNAKFPESLLTK